MDNCVTVTMVGGMGNRIFIILAGLAYAERNNKTFVFARNLVDHNPHENTSNLYIEKLFPNVPIVDELLYDITYDIMSQPFRYRDIPYLPGNIHLKGYFQTEKFFPKEVPTIKTAHYENIYFIHIRLGDYIGHPCMQMNLDNYYGRSIDLITQKDPNAKFLVFSNDPVNAKGYIERYRLVYKMADTVSSYDTLVEMANCSGGICANSSLSWLGAFFQRTPRTDVYMPSMWANTTTGWDTADVYPSWATVVPV
jgi:hypothetical protein